MTELDWMLIIAAYHQAGRRRSRARAKEILESDKLIEKFRQWTMLHLDRDDPPTIEAAKA